MITGRDLVVLADDWHGLPNSTMHLVCHLGRHNRVFWFNLVSRMPRLTWSDLRRTRDFLAASLRWPSASQIPRSDRSVLVPNDPHVVTPLMVPWFGRAGRWVNRASLLRSYRALLKYRGIRDPIIIVVYPTAADFVDSIDACLKVYYCVDDWSELPGLDGRLWRQLEDKLLNSVDAFVATSDDLMQKWQRQRPSMYLPHGVDCEHFSHNLVDHDPVPELEGIKGPVAGFFGIIGPWVDLDVLGKLSDRFKKVSFVFIGKNNVNLNGLQYRDNMFFLGSVPYTELPRFAAYFQVGLIPFVVNKLTRAVNPLKLLEYFALGLPVLATRLPELEGTAGPLYLASSTEEFCVLLNAILSEEGCLRSNEAVRIARENTWDARAEQLSEFIDGLC